MTEFNPGGAGSLDEAVKQRYEANPDTNAFTDAEKAKLAGVTGSGSPAGSATEVQYRDGAAFGAAARLSVGSAGNPVLGSNATQPGVPPADGLLLYARRRAGADWLEVLRPNGRAIALGPHLGLNRISYWMPSSGASIDALGMPRGNTGATSTATRTATTLAASVRRWTVASSATANSAADERAIVRVCWRGHLPRLGGWTYSNRIALNSRQTNSQAFFGLMESQSAISGAALLSSFTNIVGVSFDAAATNWRVVHNDTAGAPTQVDTGIPVATGELLTIFIYAAPNGSSVWVRLVNDTAQTAFEHEVTSDLPSDTTFLSVRNYLNNGGAAASVSYDCSGVYVESDY